MIPLQGTSFQCVIPVEGLDAEYIWKLSQVLEISFDRNDPAEMAALRFTAEESFRQMFIYFDDSPAVYMRMLEGELTNNQVPGLPNRVYFGHIQDLLTNNVKWYEMVTIFRHYALQMYEVVLRWASYQNLKDYNFAYVGYPTSGGGLIFQLVPKQTSRIYDI